VKILFVGDLNPLGRSSQRKRALEESGHRIIPHSSTPYGIPPDWKPALLGRVLWKAGLPPDLTGTNAAITEGVTRHRPDILWIEKGNTVWPWTLARVRRAAPDTRIVSYTEDDMSARHNRSVFYRQGLKHYDTVFTTKSYNCRPEELPRRTSIVRCAWMHEMSSPSGVTSPSSVPTRRAGRRVCWRWPKPA
jgi:spore maturation protein CgeB